MYTRDRRRGTKVRNGGLPAKSLENEENDKKLNVNGVCEKLRF